MSRSDLLLDTHVALWWLDEDPSLLRRARPLIESADRVYVSTASLWEIAIKVSIGKLKVPDGLPQMFVDSGFEVLAISADHSWEVRRLNLYHSDPFDRLLVAQANCEGLKLITADRKLTAYGPSVLCI